MAEDRVIVLQKDARYIVRLHDTPAYSDEELKKIRKSVDELINGDAHIIVISFDFELIQIVNE